MGYINTQDAALVAEASRIRNFDWGKFKELYDKCSSDSAREEIRKIESREYHREEALVGNI